MKPINLPVDLTGKDPANKVTGEVVTTVNRKVRAILPEYGAFFAASLVVTDLATNQPLKKGQYLATEMYPWPTMQSGQEVCALVLVLDPTVSNNLSIDYQALGGETAYSLEALQQLIDDAKIDDRPVDFVDIQGRPYRYPVAPHQHDGSEIYGWDYVVAELGRLAAASYTGTNQARIDAHNNISRTIQNVMTDADAKMQASMDAHTQHPNPHQQYAVLAELNDRIALVRKPKCNVVVAGGVNISGTSYQSFYNAAQSSAHFQVSRATDFAALLVDRALGAVQSYNVAETLPVKTNLFARLRYRDSDGIWSDFSDPFAFTTA